MNARDAGFTLVSTLAGFFVGVLIIGGLSIFWLNSTKSANRTIDVSNQEASALRVVNGVVGDVNSANTLLHADPDTIVVERSDDNIVRTRYHLEKDPQKTAEPNVFEIVRTINKNSPAGTYAESTTFPTDGVGVGTTSESVAQKVKDVPLFRYFTKDGDEVTEDAPKSSAINISMVQRVDINFKAYAGRGYVELSTKAALEKTATGGESDTGDPSDVASCDKDDTVFKNNPRFLGTWRHALGTWGHALETPHPHFGHCHPHFANSRS